MSSVIPADAAIDVVREAPELGTAGERVTVVEGRKTLVPGEVGTATACLGWSREPDGPGIFYESSGTAPDPVRDRAEAGLDAGRELRSWAFEGRQYRAAVVDVDSERYTTAVVTAVYGRSSSLP